MTTTSVRTHYRDDHTTLYTAEAATGIAALPAGSIDCLVTTPPPWRSDTTSTAHHTDTQLGTEPTPGVYVDRLRQIFAAARRVLTRRATVWIALGDSDATNTDSPSRAPGHQPSPRRRGDGADIGLAGMPWRVAIALQDDGWIVRSAIVWHTPESTPPPRRDHLAHRYTMLFFLAAHDTHHFDLDPIRQPYTGHRSLAQRARRQAGKPNSIRTTWPPSPAAAVRGRNPGDVWTIPTGPAHTPHTSPSSLDIPRRAIAAGCPDNGTVLDPFSGAGTTGLAARELGRSYVGIDTNPDNHDQALHRRDMHDHPRCGTDSSSPRTAHAHDRKATA